MRRTALSLLLTCWGAGFVLLSLSTIGEFMCKWDPYLMGFASGSFFWGGIWYWRIGLLTKEEK